MIEHDRVGAVIFDLGGVLVELGPVQELLGGLADDPVDFWPRWLHSAAVRAFECGHSSPGQFARALVVEFGLEIEPAELIERFRAWPRGLYDGAEELIRELRASRPSVVTGALSNSNPIHWWEQTDAEVIRGLFDHPFLSHEMSLIKPDRAVFEHVAGALDVEPDRILYFDDNALNVEGARALGWHAHLADGPAACRSVLGRVGLLGSL